MFNSYSNYSDNVDDVLVFLDNQWNKLYEAGNHSNDAVLSCNVNNVAHKIVCHINNCYNFSHDSYPYYKVSDDYIKVNYGVVGCYADYDAILKQINLLIWAISKANNNEFGLFMAEWNYAMSLERNNAPIRKVVESIRKYQGNYSNFDDWDAVDHENYANAESQLISDADSVVPNTHSEALILDFVVNHAWNNLIMKSAHGNSTESVVLSNASQIANNGTNDFMVRDFLKSFNIVNGAKLQNKLVKGISYNDDFKSARGYAIAISKITNPNSMFYFNNQNPWSIHRVSGHEIIKAVKAHKNARKHYQKLVDKKAKVNNQLKAMKHKYNF